VDLTAFRREGGVAGAVSLLPRRVQVLLAAEWARSVVPVLSPEGRSSGHEPSWDRTPPFATDAASGCVEAATDWALGLVESADPLLASLDRIRAVKASLHIYSKRYKAALAALYAATAALQPASAPDHAERVAGCAALATQSPGRSLATAWGWLLTTYRQALGPPVRFDPAWRTEAAVGLARGIVRDRALDRMPVLADTLWDAGCEEEALGHMIAGCTLADWTLWNLLCFNGPCGSDSLG